MLTHFYNNGKFLILLCLWCHNYWQDFPAALLQVWRFKYQSWFLMILANDDYHYLLDHFDNPLDIFVEGPGGARRCCVPYMQGHVPAQCHHEDWRMMLKIWQWCKHDDNLPGILSDVGAVAIPLVMRWMGVVCDLGGLAQVGIVYCRLKEDVFLFAKRRLWGFHLVDSGGPHPMLLSPIIHPKSSRCAQNCAGACPRTARQLHCTR